LPKVLGDVRNRLKSTSGQALILVVLAMPMFFSVVGLVADGSNLMVHRRQMQNAADGAALAAAQDLAGVTAPAGIATCDSSWATEKNDPIRKLIVQDVEDYSGKNSGPSTLDGGSCSWDTARCSVASDTNCYTWPYNGSSGLLEVRLKDPPFTGFFSGVVDGLFPGNPLPQFGPKARAVASTLPVVNTTTTTIPGTTNPGTVINGTTYFGTTNPGSSSTNTSTTTSGGVGAVAFLKSTDCHTGNGGNAVTAAIEWSGSNSPSMGALVANGGINVQGNTNKSATHIQLGRYSETACRQFFGSSTPNPANFPDVSQLQGAPLNWPIAPPSPAPPTVCTALPPDNRGNFLIDSAWLTAHPNGGIFCLGNSANSTGTLTISVNSGTFNGYTFFAPTNALQSNGLTFSNATPPSGQPPTVFDAYNGDLTISGQSLSITGDIFAPKGTMVLSGGGATTGNGGQGFMEALKLDISGNFANFQGTGPLVGATTSTSTSTSTYPGTTVPGSTVPPTTVAGTTDPGSTTTNSTTVGSTIGLGE
jgi:hypothetical protein